MLVSVEEAMDGTTEAPHYGTLGTIPLKHNFSLKHKSQNACYFILKLFSS